MRIVIVSVPGQRKQVPEYVKSLAKGVESLGHNVDILDGWTGDGIRLPAYEYIVVCAEAVSAWGGKMPEALQKILGSGSGLVGKKGAAFLRKTSPIFVTRALGNVMRSMEKEGMRVNYSDIILSNSHAEALGKRLNP